MKTTPPASSSSAHEAPANWRLKEWFPELDDKTHENLRTYFDELLKFNKVVNLISAKTVPHADALHFADSILSSREVRKKAIKNDMLYDIGSGNGFPGLVYGMIFPDQKVALVDSDERKCEFLKHVVGLTGVGNVEVMNRKIESFAPDSISQALCRGFAPLPRALLLLRRIFKKGGNIFHLKSDEWSIEVAQIPIQLCSIWQPLLDSQYFLPIGEIRLYVVRTEKIG